MSTSNQNTESGAHITWVPDLIYADGRFSRDVGLTCDAGGRVVALSPMSLLRTLMGGEPREGETYDITISDRYFATRFIRLRNRALLPGMVNAHSHAFQRVIRGRTEYRSPAASDSFWTWREMMYSAAARLSPEDIYDASRMAFMEMTLTGVTSVGEFHYLHRTPEGAPYDEANLLAKEVVRAARDVGLRIALLRVAYARSGFGTPPNERQRRFIESDPSEFIRNAEALDDYLARAEASSRDGEAEAPRRAWAGVAPHSVRAVPVEYARAVAEFARARALCVHMHVAEQPAETAACVEETGLTPVALLADSGILDSRFTGVHAVHVTPEETDALAAAGATVCACPTTERNLGDGVVPADEMFARGVRVALGTDSHAQIDLLEDARELEYHLRLQKLRRNVLAPPAAAGDADGEDREAHDEASQLPALAARLFDCATVAGAHSIGAGAGQLAPGSAADFFTVDLEDPSVAGAGVDDLLPAIVFSMARTALRETVVGGRLVVSEGRHPAQEEVVACFSSLQRKLWGR